MPGGGDGSAGGMGHKKEKVIEWRCRRIWLGVLQRDECSAQHSLPCAMNPLKFLDGPIALGWRGGSGPTLQKDLLTLLCGKHEAEVSWMRFGHCMWNSISQAPSPLLPVSCRALNLEQQPYLNNWPLDENQPWLVTKAFSHPLQQVQGNCCSH